LKAIDIIKKRQALWAMDTDTDIDKIDQDKEFVAAIGEYIISPGGAELRKEVQEHPEYLIEMCFVIVNKEQDTVPFFINTVQWEFLHTLNAAKQDFDVGKRLQLNFLILKGRQQG
jgi:hypothetical protein